MSSGNLAKVEAKNAAEVGQGLPLSETAQKLLRPDLTPGQYLAVLMEQRLYPDAIRFLASALPKREAVWWACGCIRAMPDPLDAPAAIALQAAEKWAADPSDENRRAAMPAAEAVGLAHPAGCIAAACFWSGGSLAPPDLPPVAPAAHLTAHVVTASLLLAAVRAEPVQAPEKQRQFLKLGLDVASGVNRWKEPAPK
ncbi:MAG TPA: hypothetical protein VMG10_24285 [Gemmataceae bacterium]|nr:hypothetical protein [Gemmataceae bacterium]